MPNTKQEINAFRQRLRSKAHALATAQGMRVGALPKVSIPEKEKRHTCSKAIPGFQQDGPCAECEYELRVKERLTQLLGPPISSSQL